MRNIIIGIICVIVCIIMGAIRIIYGLKVDTELASMIYDIVSGCIMSMLGIVGLGWFLGSLLKYKKEK
jgi:hypothetical protein